MRNLGGILAVACTAFLAMVSAAPAADIRLLPLNPVFEGGWWQAVTDIHSGGGYSYGNNDGGLSIFTPDGTGDGAERAKREVFERLVWAFDDGLGLDGALTYEDTHSAAAMASAAFGRVIHIEGVIRDGDTAALKALVTRERLMDCLRPGYCPFNNVISLNSPGGSLTEALAIAEFVYENNFVTLIGKDAECASACSMIFLSGATNFEGVFYPRRFAHETARVGLHQPFLQVPERSYSAEEVAQAMGIVNTSLNRIVELFAKVRIDLPILQSMYAAEPEAMYYLTVPELESIGMVYRDLSAAPVQMDRARALTLCAEDYKSRFGRYDPALLTQMASDDGVFVTFVPRTGYACYGAKRGAAWSYDVCYGGFGTGDRCAIWQCAVDFETGRCQGQYDQNDIDLFNLEMGDALLYMRNSRLLSLVRDAIDTSPPTAHVPSVFQAEPGTAAIPAWVARAKVPQAYCERVDMRAIPNLQRIQAALNANGFDVGTPDGSIGPRTLGAIEEANHKFFDRASNYADVPLLLALGIPVSEVPSFMLCP